MAGKLKFLAILAAPALLSAPMAASAHHSANAQFIISSSVTKVGVLKEIKDIRPHAWWIFQVDGEEWRFESLGTGQLRNQGIMVKDDLKVGESYTIKYAPARDQSKMGFLKSITIRGKEYTIVRI
jgi:hypothetical protein